MSIKNICVCGAGTMGSGIAQAAAQAGVKTILYDFNSDMLQTAKDGIEKNINGQIEKGKMNNADKENIIRQIHFTHNPEACIADVFIEAIVEKSEIKISLFNQLAEINNVTSIFASNTSSLSVTSLAEKIKHPERVIGMHFFNPATVMKLVEVVKTSLTHESVVQTIANLAKQMNKIPVVCKDSPGFIVNRVARPFYIEALRIAEESGNNFRQADTILETSGFKMGPFKLMDLIGNDVNYAVSCSIYEQLNKPEHLKPSYIQKEKVETGRLGKKSGEGYYKYF